MKLGQISYIMGQKNEGISEELPWLFYDDWNLRVAK
jgi:hypothetical protein